MGELRASVSTSATPERLWDTITDWPGQSRWIPLTRTRLVTGPERAGARIEGWTGVGAIGFLDPMVIEVWEPPNRLVLRHVGRVVKGRAGFDIVPVGAGSRLTWWEEIEPPFGVVGRALWPLTVPPGVLVLKWCLRRVAAIASTGR